MRRVPQRRKGGSPDAVPLGLPVGLGDGDEAPSPADKLGIERRPRRSIAELAASGHSNREIAQALFVTPRRSSTTCGTRTGSSRSAAEASSSGRSAAANCDGHDLRPGRFP
jgi:hypothetical protein